MSTDKTARGQPGEDDAQVSAVYRDSAAVTTPEHLDTLVLRRAASVARPPLGRMRSWTRPLAWAATIALSLAIVLEVARSPAPDGTPLTPVPAMKRVDEPAAADTESGSPATRHPAEQDTTFGGSAATLPAATRKLALPVAAQVSEETVEPAACDADARSTAESWLACIEQLEKSGETAAADRERKLFVAAFPDFLPH